MTVTVLYVVECVVVSHIDDFGAVTRIWGKGLVIEIVETERAR